MNVPGRVRHGVHVRRRVWHGVDMSAVTVVIRVGLRVRYVVDMRRLMNVGLRVAGSIRLIRLTVTRLLHATSDNYLPLIWIVSLTLAWVVRLALDVASRNDWAIGTVNLPAGIGRNLVQMRRRMGNGVDVRGGVRNRVHVISVPVVIRVSRRVRYVVNVRRRVWHVILGACLLRHYQHCRYRDASE